MPDGPTLARQQTEVGEGLAVGCLVVGVSATTSDAELLDRAFSSAFRTWPWSARYPRAGRLEPILRRSPRRRGNRIAQWFLSRGLYVPQLRDDEWDLAAACVLVEESTAIPARRWSDLAATFAGALDDDQVWRTDPVDPGILGSPT